LHVRFWHICVAVYCVPWVAVSCSVLQCVAVCCSILHDGILWSGSSFDPRTSPKWPSQRVSKHTRMKPAPSLPALVVSCYFLFL